MTEVIALKPYELSGGDFVSGTYKVFEMHPKDRNNQPADLTKARAYFSVSDYVNSGDPIVSKAGKIVLGNTVRAELTPEESAKLCGKYIYQFTVIDASGATYCARGLLTVWKNTDLDVLEDN